MSFARTVKHISTLGKWEYRTITNATKELSVRNQQNKKKKKAEDAIVILPYLECYLKLKLKFPRLVSSGTSKRLSP